MTRDEASQLLDLIDLLHQGVDNLCERLDDLYIETDDRELKRPLICLKDARSALDRAKESIP